MATFKVGQRVRIVSTSDEWTGESVIGREGVVVALNTDPHFYPYVVQYEGPSSSVANEFGRNRGAFAGSNLAPMADPGADAFLERIKKLKPEPESIPLPAKVKA